MTVTEHGKVILLTLAHPVEMLVLTMQPYLKLFPRPFQESGWVYDDCVGIAAMLPFSLRAEQAKNMNTMQ